MGTGVQIQFRIACIANTLMTEKTCHSSSFQIMSQHCVSLDFLICTLIQLINNFNKLSSPPSKGRGKIGNRTSGMCTCLKVGLWMVILISLLRITSVKFSSLRIPTGQYKSVTKQESAMVAQFSRRY